VPSDELVGTEFLQVVRFGLRSPDDPLILDSIRVVDALLETETPCGPVWHRYNGDGYGEHDDGSPYDGTGGGRGWPLLTGERGHYELAASRDSLPFLDAMTTMAGPALVRVKDLRLAMPCQSPLQDLDAEFSAECVRQPPPQHRSAAPVHDRDQMEKALDHRDIEPAPAKAGVMSEHQT
jgi:hypothetical protein